MKGYADRFCIFLEGLITELGLSYFYYPSLDAPKRLGTSSKIEAGPRLLLG